MRNITIWLILGIFHVFAVREVLLECKQTRLLIEKYDGITNEFLIWRGLVDSKLGCLKRCFFDFKCVTFQHDEKDGTCSMYAAELDVLKTWMNATGVGVSTAELRSIGFLGSECMRDDECLFPNSECRNSRCGCIIGYSFNPMENACTYGCTTFSKSYTTFPGVGFMYDYDQHVQNLNSLEDCQNFCSTSSICKSVDYLNNGQCFIKPVVVLDFPTYVLQSSDITHGVRNCFN